MKLLCTTIVAHPLFNTLSPMNVPPESSFPPITQKSTCKTERYGPQDLLTCRHHWCSSNNSFICYKSGSRGRMLARVFPHHSFRRR
ncbi:hypothetical protein E1A91_A08G159100v1 [Gossypium mustelinum]|uniref:Uncharacterized protein n=1 Tax=Gossypium mustelinum TaxID=34275 RepID=A0A5D2YAW2_GOSMU|nr:hypothetical protein E1A91_A08G159100v1 [Gossypium mustelinum]